MVTKTGSDPLRILLRRIHAWTLEDTRDSAKTLATR